MFTLPGKYSDILDRAVDERDVCRGRVGVLPCSALAEAALENSSSPGGVTIEDYFLIALDRLHRGNCNNDRPALQQFSVCRLPQRSSSRRQDGIVGSHRGRPGGRGVKARAENELARPAQADARRLSHWQTRRLGRALAAAAAARAAAPVL